VVRGRQAGMSGAGRMPAGRVVRAPTHEQQARNPDFPRPAATPARHVESARGMDAVEFRRPMLFRSASFPPSSAATKVRVWGSA